MDSQTFAKAKTAVFRYLKYRPRSVHEIQLKLRRKNFPSTIINQTVDYFKKIGCLDDQQFAHGWVRSRLNKPLGIRRIRQELKLKGIEDELITQAITNATQDYEECEYILALAKRRLRQYTNLDQRTAQRRLYVYLARRGFNSGAILKTIYNIF